MVSPGLPYFSFGGKYVPPANTFPPGVKNAVRGQPPLPVIALTAL